MLNRLVASEQRWIRALLILATIAVAVFLADQALTYVSFFSDQLLMLLVAWLFAFILSPVAGILLRAVPHLPRTIAVVLVYAGLFVGVTAIGVVVVGSIAGSLQGLNDNVEDLQARLTQALAPVQAYLASLGFQDVRLGPAALDALRNLIQPLTDIALTGLTVVFNLMLVIFLSLFIVLDKDRMLAFANRLVPQRYSDEARLFQTSVASSFGGFLRGQAIQGLVYGAFAAIGSIVLGVDYWPVTTVLVAVLQMIPFFGPFFSWAPPVIAAVLAPPVLMVDGLPSGPDPQAAVVPIFIVMAVGWFVTMNIVQPKVMGDAVGIHPVLVLTSVLIGLRIYGVVGGIFAIPVAAVISAFFFHYLNRNAGAPRDVTSRAARRVEEREGRRVRVPTPPAVVGPAAPEVVAASAGVGAATAGRLGGHGSGRVPPADGTP